MMQKKNNSFSKLAHVDEKIMKIFYALQMGMKIPKFKQLLSDPFSHILVRSFSSQREI